MSDEIRTVGKRGQITIPKALRDRFGISGGDEVTVRERDGRIVVETPVDRERMAGGYRRRAERSRELADAFESVSDEADDVLGDPPEW